MIRVRVSFGVGYGEHDTVLEFEDGTSPEQIEEDASGCANEKFWWSHEVLADDAE